MCNLYCMKSSQQAMRDFTLGAGQIGNAVSSLRPGGQAGGPRRHECQEHRQPTLTPLAWPGIPLRRATDCPL